MNTKYFTFENTLTKNYRYFYQKLKIINMLLIIIIFSTTSMAEDISLKHKLSRLSSVEINLGSHNTFISIDQLIGKYKLPGLSLAIVDDYEIIFSTYAGVTATNNPEIVNEKTAFNGASMAKAITAILAMMLVEEKKLHLDKPINQYLKTWQLAESLFTKKQPITLRHLLSHTAGTSQSGFADFYQGDKIPTLTESLNGINLPRYNKPISVLSYPGSQWRYSGGGYVIIQLVLETITGKSLEELAEQRLFSPLSMHNTTFYQPGTQQFSNKIHQTAKVHDKNFRVIRSGLPICPQIAASGLWSTPEDLALLIIDFQKALAVKDSKIISPWVAKMTTNIETIDISGGWGLGWMRFEASGNLDWFSHGGSNTGVGGHMMASMIDGRAIILFGNGEKESRLPVFNLLINHIIKTLSWGKSLPESDEQPTSQLIERMTGLYKTAFDSDFKIFPSEKGLVYEGTLSFWSSKKKGELIYIGDGYFAADEYPNFIKLESNPKDNKEYLTIYRPNTNLKSFHMIKSY